MSNSDPYIRIRVTSRDGRPVMSSNDVTIAVVDRATNAEINLAPICKAIEFRSEGGKELVLRLDMYEPDIEIEAELAQVVATLRKPLALGDDRGVTEPPAEPFEQRVLDVIGANAGKVREVLR